MSNKIVLIESPYSGDIPRNIAYAQRCMYDSRMRGEITLATHLLWTQHHLAPQHFVSDYDEKYEVPNCGRDVSLQQICALREMIQREGGKVVFYIDYGYSSGMTHGLEHCKRNNIPYEERRLNKLDKDIENASARTFVGVQKAKVISNKF